MLQFRVISLSTQLYSIIITAFTYLWFCFQFIAPPRYTLECDSIIDVANESLKIGFTVTSEHPMPSNPEHTIIREDGGTVRCKIEGQFIIFSKLDVRDSGRYTISCCNVNKCEGKETFELDVTPGMHLVTFV